MFYSSSSSSILSCSVMEVVVVKEAAEPLREESRGMLSELPAYDP